MSIGEVLLIFVGLFLLLAIAVKEWERYERAKVGNGLSKKRRIFRERC